MYRLCFSRRRFRTCLIAGRNFTGLQLLLPGAQELGWSHAASENPQGSKQIMVDGQAFAGTAYELDGTDNQDPILGIIVVNPNFDSLSETKDHHAELRRRVRQSCFVRRDCTDQIGLEQVPWFGF